MSSPDPQREYGENEVGAASIQRMNQHRQTQTERLYDILADYDWHSTRELYERTKIYRIGSRIFDLKKQGKSIEARPTMIDGVRWEEYRLARPEPQQVTIPLVTTYTV